MRSDLLAAAAIGALAGAAAGWMAGTASGPQASAPSGPATSADAGLSAARLARLETSLSALGASLDRLAVRLPASSATSQDAAPPAAREEPGGAPRRTSRARPAAQAEPRSVEFAGFATEDLELEADERHSKDTDVAGAARRYRELLARPRSAAQARRWSMRLGDCLIRLNRTEAAMEAYRAAVDASPEDSEERYDCLRALARNAADHEDWNAAFAWNDDALRSQFVDAQAQGAALSWAYGSGRTDRVRTALELLLAKYPESNEAPSWREQLANLDGR